MSIAILYLMALILGSLKLLFQLRGSKALEPSSQGNLAIYLGILLVLAAIRTSNFDLYFLQHFRSFLELYGWYEGRRPIQVILLAIVIIPASIMMIHEYRGLEGRSRSDLITAAGIYTLLCLVVVALISFHYTDLILMQPIGSTTLFSLLEATALTLIIGSYLSHFRLSQSK